MRLVLAGLFLLASAGVGAEQGAQQYDPVKFKERFDRADVDKAGRLSRQQAYGEFPRMPEFFDEIDANGDDHITLQEVDEAAQRRVDAAFRASDLTTRYGMPSDGTTSQAAAVADDQESLLRSKTEARRQYRLEYYESLSAEKAQARQMGEPVPKSPSSPLLK